MIKRIIAVVAMISLGSVGVAADDYSLFAIGHGKAAAAPNEYNLTIIIAVSALDLIQGKKALDTKTAAIAAAIKKATNSQIQPEYGMPMVLNDLNRNLVSGTSEGLVPASMMLSFAATTGPAQYMREIYLTVDEVATLNEIKDAAFANDAYLLLRPALSMARAEENANLALERAAKDAIAKAKVLAAANGITKIEFGGVEEVNDTASNAGTTLTKNTSPGMIEVEKTVRIFYKFDPSWRKK